jgi:hypothetical protein
VEIESATGLGAVKMREVFAPEGIQVADSGSSSVITETVIAHRSFFCGQ